MQDVLLQVVSTGLGDPGQAAQVSDPIWDEEHQLSGCRHTPWPVAAWKVSRGSLSSIRNRITPWANDAICALSVIDIPWGDLQMPPASPTSQSDTKLLLTKNYSEIMIFGKITNLTRNSLKMSVFPGQFERTKCFKITKNNSQELFS